MRRGTPTDHARRGGSGLPAGVGHAHFRNDSLESAPISGPFVDLPAIRDAGLIGVGYEENRMSVRLHSTADYPAAGETLARCAAHTGDAHIPEAAARSNDFREPPCQIRKSTTICV